MGVKISYGKKNDIALNTWIKLARCFTVVSNLTNENIRDYNLTTPQFSVLEVLGHLGPMRVGQLCDKMLISGGNMTLVLDNLEKSDLIERHFTKDDRRAILISLTQKGTDLFTSIFSQHADKIGNIFSVLSADEQKQLGSMLKKLGLALSKKE